MAPAPSPLRRWRRPIFALGLALGLAAAASPAAAGPQRVVSLNLCADQFAVLLLEPERIAALSFLSRDPSLSYVAEAAEGFEVTSDEAEDVLRRRPDLVLAGPFAKPQTLRLLRARGIAVHAVGMPQDFDAIAAEIAGVAAALGEEARGAGLIAEMRRTLDAARPRDDRRPVALTYQAGGFTAGGGTLSDAVLRAAGWRNFAAESGLSGYGYLGLETVLSGRPDLLIADAGPEGAPSLAEALLAHPALRGLERMRLPGPLVACGGPFTAQAVALLAAARGERP
ncbi:MAG TPA: ABC transporter substrate-binding protein [Alphaproteobacteria bacterium]|nr:ABC transporter substrate-binding protein [Alphaproteobacteria bacterium]